MRPLMTCRELIGFLDGYVEETLSDAQRREFDRHLERCPMCVAYLASYRKTITLARLAAEAPDEPPPESVPEELIAAILAARRR